MRNIYKSQKVPAHEEGKVCQLRDSRHFAQSEMTTSLPSPGPLCPTYAPTASEYTHWLGCCTHMLV